MGCIPPGCSWQLLTYSSHESSVYQVTLLHSTGHVSQAFGDHHLRIARIRRTISWLDHQQRGPDTGVHIGEIEQAIQAIKSPRLGAVIRPRRRERFTNASRLASPLDASLKRSIDNSPTITLKHGGGDSSHPKAKRIAGCPLSYWFWVGAWGGVDRLASARAK